MEREITEYINHSEKLGLKNTTVQDKAGVLENFYLFIKENFPDINTVTDITGHVISSYEKYLMTKRGDSSYTKRKVISRNRRARYLSVVKDFFNYLLRNDMVYRNPAVNMAVPKKKRPLPKDILTIEEMERVLKSCRGLRLLDLRDRAILELLYSTGIRASELCRIMLEDVDLEERILFVRKSKNDKERHIPFGEQAAYWLERYLEKARPLIIAHEDEYLFSSAYGRKMQPRVLWDIVKKWADTAGIEKNITTHSFRHSCATHMLKGRADIRYVQLQLGHKLISTTEKYLKIEITDLKEVHERCHPREQDDW
jgi:integrase/recombinase XerD